MLIFRSPGHQRTKSNGQMSPVLGANDARNMPRSSPLQNPTRTFQSNYMPPPESGRDAVQDAARDLAIDPRLETTEQDRSQEQGYKDAIKAWSRFRFVRAGWFTPAEAIEYIT